MISIGAEGIWLKAGNASNQYFKPRMALSGSYAFNGCNHSYRTKLHINKPSSWNRSTESLQYFHRFIGDNKRKSDLLPIQNHRIDASYTFNKAGWF